MNDTMDATTTSTDSHCPLSYLDVAGCDTHMLICVGGLANMHLALTLQQFTKNSCDLKYRDFILDFSRCRGLDSTFMGTLVSLMSMLAENEGQFQLVNVGEQCQKNLQMLGVYDLLDVHGEQKIPEVEFTRLVPVADNTAERLKLIRHAHERLCQADPSNRERFGAFLAMLSES